jgi:putative membrane protein
MMNRYGCGNDYGIWRMHWWGLGFELLGFVLMAIFLFYLFKRHRQQSSQLEGAPTALDILKNRYAKGEITQEEFNTMKEHLK